MKIPSLLFVWILSLASVNAQNIEWGTAISDQSDGIGNSIVTDLFGNVYTTGTFGGTADFDPGPGIYNLTSSGFYGIFVQKLDPSGNLIWAKSFGGTYYNISNSITVDFAGNVYTTGYFWGAADFDPGDGETILTAQSSTSDIFIQKLDNSGNLIWAKSFGGNQNDEGYSIITDQQGNVYSVGRFKGNADLDPSNNSSYFSANGGYDIYVLKLDPSGDYIWAKTYGSAEDDIGVSISLDNSKNSYITGTFENTINFNPPSLSDTIPCIGLYDSYIIKLDSLGNNLWNKSIGGSDIVEAKSIKVDNSSNIHIVGNFQGTVDFNPGYDSIMHTSYGNSDIFYLKLNSEGNFVNAKTIGGASSESGQAVALDNSENVYITGYYQLSVDFDPNAGNISQTSEGILDIYILKLDSNGNFLWVKTIGGNQFDAGHSIWIDDSDNIYTTGYLSGSIEFNTVDGVDTISTPDANNYDVFVFKMSQGAEARGFVFWDIDSNGILDAFDIPLQNQYVSYSSENNLAITNSNGLFRSFPPTGNQNIYYQVPNYFTNTTSNPQNFNVQLNTIDTVYFGIQSLSSINDLKVEIHAFTLPRPGFSRNYMIQYNNIGTNNLNNVKLKFLKSDEDIIVSATGNYTLEGDTIIWDIGSLSPFNFGQYTVETTLSTAAIFGEYIQTQAWIEPSIDDFNQTNNHEIISELVVSSCDPNDKTVLPETSLPFENIKLEYIIRFQNTGNYQADFVIVKDTLDQYLDINTLEMVGASHYYELQIENRIATWNFSEINLPDSLSDEPNSHGFIKFKINKSQGLPAGTEIPNKVAIYFDYNSPIITNTCIFSIQEPLINDDAGNSIGAVAFPIPSSNLVQLTVDKTLTNTELTLTNLVGQIIFRSNFETLSNIEFYLPEATGIYFLTIKTEEEIKVLRLIKE